VKPSAHPRLGNVVLRNVAILDSESPFVPRGYVWIQDERIHAVGPEPGLGGSASEGGSEISLEAAATSPPGVDPAARAVDGRGLAVIPGLINAHTHLALTHLRGIADDVRLFPFLHETRKRWRAATWEETRRAALDGCRGAIRSATTTLCDSAAMTPHPVADAGRAAGVRIVGAGAARSTWFGAPDADTFDATLRETQAAADAYAGDDLLYVPSFAAHSPYNCTPEQIRRVKDACRERGWLFAIHLAEVSEEVELIRKWHGVTPTRYLDSLGVLDDRTILAHGVFLDGDDLKSLADRGAHLAHCPKSNAKLGDGVAPIPDALRAGVSVGLGTDSMVSNNNLDMIEEMRFGALIHRAVRFDPSILTARAMFEMATIGGARALGLGAEIGSLRAGKRADLALIELRPPQGAAEDLLLSELVFHATADAVRAVIVNGNVIWEDTRGACDRLVVPE
jgi:5-methylthioadenosine/S-adenosylhomocysteine deaminase